MTSKIDIRELNISSQNFPPHPTFLFVGASRASGIHELASKLAPFQDGIVFGSAIGVPEFQNLVSDDKRFSHSVETWKAESERLYPVVKEDIKEDVKAADAEKATVVANTKITKILENLIVGADAKAVQNIVAYANGKDDAPNSATAEHKAPNSATAKYQVLNAVTAARKLVIVNDAQDAIKLLRHSSFASMLNNARHVETTFMIGMDKYKQRASFSASSMDYIVLSPIHGTARPKQTINYYYKQFIKEEWCSLEEFTEMLQAHNNDFIMVRYSKSAKAEPRFYSFKSSAKHLF